MCFFIKAMQIIEEVYRVLYNLLNTPSYITPFSSLKKILFQGDFQLDINYCLCTK